MAFDNGVGDLCIIACPSTVGGGGISLPVERRYVSHYVNNSSGY